MRALRRRARRPEVHDSIELPGRHVWILLHDFSDDLSTRFGENQEFFVQWRQRFSPEFVATAYRGASGWKQAIIGTGDTPGGAWYATCTTLEVVANNSYHRRFAQMYNSCTGSASHGPFDPFEEPYDRSDFKLQNARPFPYCLHSQVKTGTQFPPSGNCFGYFPDEWMTFQVRIKTGPRVGNEFTNSFITLWIARENQPAELALDWGPYNLAAGDPLEDQKFGKVWFLPYNTGKDASESHPTAYTWHDELIISRTRIADPTASASESASTLGQLAASLQTGQWGTLVTNNINPTLTNTGGSSGMIFGYADAMKWDPVSRRALYLGSDHSGNPTPGPNSTYRFVAYAEDTNTWSVLPTPPWAFTDPEWSSYTDAHGYDKTAINPLARRLYRNPFNSKQIHVYDIDSGAWSLLPNPPNTGNSCCDAIEYVPELGGLVWSQGTGAQLFFSESSQQWSELGTEATLASTWMFAEYNPVHKVTLLGSSTGALFLLSSAGQLTRLGDIPITLYDGSAWNGVVTVDPVSGDYLVLTPPNRQLYVYNVLEDSWQLSANSPPVPTMNAVLGTPIAAHGVVMFTHCDNRGSCGVWLYKHAAAP